ncbi:hypothetical protein VTO73DRAFT_2544 [Trametes versicolor]
MTGFFPVPEGCTGSVRWFPLAPYVNTPGSPPTCCNRATHKLKLHRASTLCLHIISATVRRRFASPWVGCSESGKHVGNVYGNTCDKSMSSGCALSCPA